MRLENLPFGIKNHITKSWISNGTEYLVIAGGRIHDTLTKCVMLIRLYPRTYYYLPSLPVPIENAGGFIVKDSLYVAGGSSEITDCGYRKTLYKLNLKNPVSWQQKADMPNELTEITFGTTALNDTVVYVAGGLDINNNAVNSCLMYNPKTNIWQENPSQYPIPYKAYGASLGVVNDSVLILIGGRKDNTIYSNIRRGIVKHGEPGKITWSNLLPYPSGPVYHIGCWGTKMGLAFFTGGTGGTNTKNSPLSTDSIYATTYAYIEQNQNITFVCIKPTPVTQTQLDGFIVPSGKDTLYNCMTAGGASTIGGQGINVVQGMTCARRNDKFIIIYLSIGRVPGGHMSLKNFPNPFNPTTKIYFEISRTNFVNLKVFDISGRLISTIVAETLSPGNYEYNFDGTNLSSGIYFIRMQTDDFVNVGQMILLK
jgi:hypothetical protein